MNKKNWLKAVAIVSILAITFFWGGNFQKQKIYNDNQVAQTTEEASLEDAQVAVGSNINVDSIEGTIDENKTTSAESTNSSEETTEIPPSKPFESDSKPAEHAPSATAANDASKESIKEAVNHNENAASVNPKPTETPAPKEGEKDKYLTDPVPSGKPEPVEWQDTKIDKKKELTITLSVSAATILDNLNIFNEDKLEVLPQDGVIYAAKKVVFYEGESVFDVLLREMKANKIHMEFNMTPIYNSNYIEGINNIYEFDCGELSGWMYKVNGWFPNYGSSRYALKDGDIVEWVYTCDLGRDVGGYVAAAGEPR